MTVSDPVLYSQRLIWDALRTVRRIARQVERRVRYKRLGWV